MLKEVQTVDYLARSWPVKLKIKLFAGEEIFCKLLILKKVRPSLLDLAH
jgi:hypothetical protein